MALRFLVTERIPDAGLSPLHDAGGVTLPPAVPSAAQLKTLCASGGYDVLLACLGDSAVKHPRGADGRHGRHRPAADPGHRMQGG